MVQQSMFGNDLDGRRAQLQALLAQRNALRQEYELWRQQYSMEEDDVAGLLMDVCMNEGTKLNERIAILARMVLMMHG